MKNLKPINNHVLIEPVPHESFLASEKTLYEEVGVVVVFDELSQHPFDFKVGDRVYFDSWMAAKFPNPEKEGSYFWLVKLDDIRAFESHDNETVSE